MTKRPWRPAPTDPGIRPGGIRDRALRAVLARGRSYEDPAKTRASQEYWAKVRAEQQTKALEQAARHSDDGEYADALSIVGVVTITRKAA
jgi:hypothetical protein